MAFRKADWTRVIGGLKLRPPGDLLFASAFLPSKLVTNYCLVCTVEGRQVIKFQKLSFSSKKRETLNVPLICITYLDMLAILRREALSLSLQNKKFIVFLAKSKGNRVIQ